MRLFVPGRLCLFGEHSDWAGRYRGIAPALSPGHCIVAGIDQGLVADVEPLERVVELASRLHDGRMEGPERWPAQRDALAAGAAASGFFSYAVGVAAEVMSRHTVGGLRIHVTASDLPIARGLSSSAAICVLVARAYNQVYRLGLPLRDEMELAYAGERRAGSACGRMDQVCAFGRRLLFLTFDGDDMTIEPLAAGVGLSLLVVDLRAQKNTRKILNELSACYPDTPGPIAREVRHGLGPLNAALVGEALTALASGDVPRLGALMTMAQDAFDAHVGPACDELVAPRLHEVLSHPAVSALAWGGKGVGSQGDGAAQLLARGPAERDALAAQLTSDLDVTCLPVTIAGSA